MGCNLNVNLIQNPSELVLAATPIILMFPKDFPPYQTMAGDQDRLSAGRIHRIIIVKVIK
jgi:hypothetical protein